MEIGGASTLPETAIPIEEIVARIQALRATHSYEAAQHRKPSRTATAEEPVTERIRNRIRELATPQPETEPEPVPPALPPALCSSATSPAPPVVLHR